MFANSLLHALLAGVFICKPLKYLYNMFLGIINMATECRTLNATFFNKL